MRSKRLIGSLAALAALLGGGALATWKMGDDSRTGTATTYPFGPNPGDGTTTAPATPHGPALHVLTSDGADRYELLRDGAKLTVEAPSTNQAGNLRTAIVDPDEIDSTDQQACVTWWGPVASLTQPGLVLRSSFRGERSRAIMVTDNIWYGSRSGLNVHVFDSNAGDHGLDLIRQVDMEPGLGGPLDPEPTPWRFCAQVRGSILRVKAWSIEGGPGEPSWADPVRTAVVQLPPDAPRSGRPGVFAGHLAPGTSTTFSDLLTGPVAEE